jgi:CheY-like chemotaxis protein
MYTSFATTLAPPGPLLQSSSPNASEPLLIIDACLPPGQIRLLRTGRDAVLMGPLWVDRLSLLKEGLIKFLRKPIRDELLFQTLLDYFLCDPTSASTLSSPSSSGSPSQSIPLALGMPLSFAPLTPPPSALLAGMSASAVLSMPHLPLSMPQLPGVNPLARLRLLLAEDNPMNQTVIRKLLSGFGITDPLVANNGREAVEMAISEPRGFDVILMDIMMPEMNGLEAAVRIRKDLQSFGRPVPAILALTANAFLEDHIKCIEAGMERVLTKPIKKDELHDALLTVATTLSTSRARSSRGSFDGSTTASYLSSTSPTRQPA